MKIPSWQLIGLKFFLAESQQCCMPHPSFWGWMNQGCTEGPALSFLNQFRHSQSPPGWFRWHSKWHRDIQKQEVSRSPLGWWDWPCAWSSHPTSWHFWLQAPPLFQGPKYSGEPECTRFVFWRGNKHWTLRMKEGGKQEKKEEKKGAQTMKDSVLRNEYEFWCRAETRFWISDLWASVKSVCARLSNPWGFLESTLSNMVYSYSKK